MIPTWICKILDNHLWRNWTCSCGYDASDGGEAQTETEHLSELIAAELRVRLDSEDTQKALAEAIWPVLHAQANQYAVADVALAAMTVQLLKDGNDG